MKCKHWSWDGESGHREPSRSTSAALQLVQCGLRILRKLSVLHKLNNFGLSGCRIYGIHYDNVAGKK